MNKDKIITQLAKILEKQKLISETERLKMLEIIRKGK